MLLTGLQKIYLFTKKGTKEMNYGQEPRQNPLSDWWEIELRKAQEK